MSTLQSARTRQIDHYKVLSELLPDRLEGGSAIFTTLEEYQQAHSQPKIDYFASLPLPSRSEDVPRAPSTVPDPALSFNGFSRPASQPDAFYQGEADLDQGSVADTLSEWGLDHLFHGEEGKNSLAASLANYQRSGTPSSLPPSGPSDHDQQIEDDGSSVQFQAVNFDGRGAGQPRARKISTTSVLTSQSSTGFSRPATPASLPSSRSGSALSRFDPGPSSREHPEEYAARREAFKMRPYFLNGDHRPKMLVMPEPLASMEYQERAQDMELEEAAHENLGEVCSIPSLRSSEESVRHEEGQGDMAEDHAKEEEPDLEELAVSRIPAGKLYGRSLMDELETRRANMKNKSRAYGGQEGRIKMADPVQGNDQQQRASGLHAEDAEPWSRFSVANFQSLMQPSETSSSLSMQQAQNPTNPPTMPSHTRSVFGVDKVMQAELAKLEKILKMEEAEKKMAAERARIEELERQAREAHKAEKERIKAEKKRKWKKSRMLDDVILSEDASVHSDPSNTQDHHKAEASTSDPAGFEPEDICYDQQQGEELAERNRRPTSVAPSLTLSHLDLNNLQGGVMDSLFQRDSHDSTSSKEDEDDSDPWTVAKSQDGHSKAFEMPSSSEIWKSPKQGKNRALPKFTFDKDDDSDSDREEQLRHPDEDDDEKPLSRVLATKQSPGQDHETTPRPRTRSRTKSDVGSLLGLEADLFKGDQTSSSSSDDSEDEPEAPRTLRQVAKTGQTLTHYDMPGSPSPAPSAKHASLPPDGDGRSSDDDDVPLGYQQGKMMRLQGEDDADDEDIPLGARLAGRIAPSQIGYEQQQQQAYAEQIALQQQAAYMAAQQQQMMFQAMMQQQQQQWLAAMQQHAQAEGSIMGAMAQPPAGQEKLARRVDDWRAGIE